MDIKKMIEGNYVIACAHKKCYISAKSPRCKFWNFDDCALRKFESEIKSHINKKIDNIELGDLGAEIKDAIWDEEGK